MIAVSVFVYWGGINYWPTEIACQMYRVKPSKLFTFVRSAKFTRIASKSSLLIQFTELIAGFPGFRQTLTAILRTYHLDMYYTTDSIDEVSQILQDIGDPHLVTVELSHWHEVT